MPHLKNNPTTTLYIHLPWCEKKCPYCDFNSHEIKVPLPQQLYVKALLEQLEYHQKEIGHRQFQTVFIGGGTPSVFSSTMMDKIIQGIRPYLKEQAEITIEANPQSADMAKFKAYFESGINRISIGIQSFDTPSLKKLGRLHNPQQAHLAIQAAKLAGFSRINLDIMYGLPMQSVSHALADLKTALAYDTGHLSWYQLTIEPNTYFAHHPPELPDELCIEQIEQQGRALIKSHQLERYEISAYAKAGERCLHNLNYWQFGDYLGIGAGAHSKITQGNQVIRFMAPKHPTRYLKQQVDLTTYHNIEPHDLPFEFMLNASRLIHGFSLDLYEKSTKLSLETIMPQLKTAEAKGFIIMNNNHITPTRLGQQFTNEWVKLFLPS